MKKNKQSIQEELEQLSPLLARIKEADQVPEAPEHYFSEMQADVLWKVRRETSPAETPSVRTSPLGIWAAQVGEWLLVLRRPTYAVSLATLALLIVAAIWVFAPRQETLYSNNQSGALTEEEVLAYIEANYESFDTSLLFEVVQMNQELPGTTTGMSEEEAEEFLDEVIKELDVNTLQDFL